MAKRKNNDEDWFEDDFEEEKPKKKKRGRKKKKTGKVVAWIVAFIVILAILLFIRFKYAAPSEEAPVEELPEEEVEEYAPELEEAEEVEEAPKEVGPDVVEPVESEQLEKVREVIDTTKEPELFSNIECDYDYDAELLYISLRIYNILDEEIRISPRGVMKGYNTYFLIRGIVDTDPGCSTEVVMPGEWVECTKIGFDAPRYANVPGINRISVQVPGKTEALLVECPAPPKTVSEEEE